LDARCGRGEVELQLLRVGQGDVDGRIAAGVDLVAGQPDDTVKVLRPSRTRSPEDKPRERSATIS
jgi:hypothetical protein